MKKTPFINKIFGNDRLVLIVSIAIATISWIVVAMTTADTIPKIIHNVPVNLDVKAENLADVGLSVVPVGETLVTVHVDGQRTIVGNLTPEDLLITVRVSGITEAGTYPLTLVSETQTEGFEITSIEPSTIQARLDQIASREFAVELDQRGVAVPPDHIPDTPTVRPSSITVTGPRSELDRIDKVQAVVELEEDFIYSTYTTNIPVALLDASGAPIVPSASSLSLNYDSVDVVIPVLKLKTVPLIIDYTNLPDQFPLNDLLRYAVSSKDYIQIAGPVSLIDSTTEIKVGAIDLREITPTNNEFSFDVILPSEYENLENIRSVTITFESEYWVTQTFSVNNIQMTNKPPGYAVEALTTSLQVTFVGPDDIMEAMTADDIVAEVRLSDREVVEGQYKYPVRLSAPTKGLVWAAGTEYTVVIQAEPLNTE